MPSSVRDAKRQGELAELVFAERATRLGWRVLKPYGESCAYDFAVDVNGKLLRVQVKSVAAERDGTYRVGSGSGHSSKRAYTGKEIDVLAAYVIPHDAWYLIPVKFCGVKSIHLSPHRKSRRKFERFREAWEMVAEGSRPSALGFGGRRTATSSGGESCIDAEENPRSSQPGPDRSTLRFRSAVSSGQAHKTGSSGAPITG